MEFISKLKLDLERLEREYEAKGTKTWSEFKSDATLSKVVVELTAADFASGTLRITKPCKLVLKEDIQFNPNRPTMLAGGLIDPDRTMDWFPTPAQAAEYLTGDVAKAYHLGFFAAIAIEAEGVIVDLNTFGLGQHPEHALMQQFFANIELSDQPFPTGSGPANFGAKLKRAKKVWIKNGTLGYSSHQNLHGNDVQEILVTNVVMKDSTVAGASFNGAKKVAMMDCEYRGTRRDVKVRGMFNELRLDMKLIEGYWAATNSKPADLTTTTLGRAYLRAKEVIETIFNEVIVGSGSISDTFLDTIVDLELKADLTLVRNAAGLPDGISYGLVFNPTDVAVGKFLESRDVKGQETSEIALIRCNIEGVVAKPMEVMALSPAIVAAQEIDAGGEVLYDVNAQQRGATGAVLSYKENMFDANGHYTGSVVSDLQIEIARLQNSLPDAMKPMLGQINVDPNIITMKDESEAGTPNLKFEPVAGEHEKVYIIEDVAAATELAEFVALAQGDVQHHVLKGVIGLRIEGASDVTLEGVTVSGTKNLAERGEDYLGAGYIGDQDGGHGGQGAMIGYFGNHTRGISIAASSNVKAKSVTVSGVESATGPALGMDIKNDTANFKLEMIEVKGVKSGTDDAKNRNVDIKGLAYSNWRPESVGIKVDSSCSMGELKSVRSDTLTQRIGKAEEISIESDSVKLA